MNNLNKLFDEPFNLVVAGGRNYNNYEFLKSRIIMRMAELNINIDSESLIIISGCARGADSLGELFASEHNLNVIKFPAAWDEIQDKPQNEIGYNKFGSLYWKKAGFYRNCKMADLCNGAILFPGGNGTDHMKNEIITRGKLLWVESYD